MHLTAILQMMTLLAAANGAPLVATRLLHTRFAFPLDGRARFVDGRPVFGSSKTFRGVASGILAAAACAPLVNVAWPISVLVASVSMAGDLFSSFAKRRLGLAPSSRATGLDQIPESLLPCLACQRAFSLTAADIAVIVAVFFVGEVVASRVLFRAHLRERPY